MDSWIVVNYLEDESVEAVPNFWYHQNKCIWPNKKNILKHCIVKRIPVTEFDHTYLKARILCSAVSYEEARKKASKAQYDSELSGIEEMKSSRKARAKKDRSYSSSPSPLTVHKTSSTIRVIKSPPLLSTAHVMSNIGTDQSIYSPTKTVQKQKLHGETVFSMYNSIAGSSNSSEIDNDDESKDPDYSIMDSRPAETYDCTIIHSPAGKFLVELNDELKDNTGNSKAIEVNNIKTNLPSKNYKRKLFNNEKSLTSPRKPAVKQSRMVIDQADFQKLVTKQLVTLRYTVDVMNTSIAATLQNIEQKIDGYFKYAATGNMSGITNDSFDDGFLWPLENEEQLQELEQTLKNNDNNFNRCLVNKMSLMNSNTVERSVRRILKYMFTDELLEQFSYTGFKKPKKSFSKLLSCQIVIDAIRSSPLFKTTTLQNIEKPIKGWLAQAKFRKISII